MPRLVWVFIRCTHANLYLLLNTGPFIVYADAQVLLVFDGHTCQLVPFAEHWPIYRLCGCAGWSESLMGTHANLYLLLNTGPFIVYADAQAVVSLWWAHMPTCTFCWTLAHLSSMRMRRLLWVFDGHTCQLVPFAEHWPIYRLCGCAGWSESLMGTHANLYLFLNTGPFIVYADAQAVVSLWWAHMPTCTFCWTLAHLSSMRMRRLVWVFDGHTCQLVPFAEHWLINYLFLQAWQSNTKMVQVWWRGCLRMQDGWRRGKPLNSSRSCCPLKPFMSIGISHPYQLDGSI